MSVIEKNKYPVQTFRHLFVPDARLEELLEPFFLPDAISRTPLFELASTRMVTIREDRLGLPDNMRKIKKIREQFRSHGGYVALKGIVQLDFRAKEPGMTFQFIPEHPSVLRAMTDPIDALASQSALPLIRNNTQPIFLTTTIAPEVFDGSDFSAKWQTLKKAFDTKTAAKVGARQPQAFPGTFEGRSQELWQ